MNALGQVKPMNMITQSPGSLTVEQFLAFYDTRPDEEQWQLVDGVALLMTPPFVVHQRIARNLEHLLNDALEMHASHLTAEQRIGIELLPDFPRYRPEPDVAVIDLELPVDRRHVDRFCLVAEVLFDSDDERIDLKRRFYRSHEHNRAILLIREDRQELEVDLRREGAWMTEIRRGPEAMLSLPEFGLTCRVGDLYRNTGVC
jgi:Uma2 family endonuclease